MTPAESPAEEFAFIGDITDYWTYTLVRDRLLHLPGLTDPGMRMYLIVRSMISESKKHLPGQGLRRMTIDQLCFLLSKDTGKPVSVSAMYQILTLLSDLDLMVPFDTKQDVGSSQLKGKEKAVKGILRSFVVRDLPPVPYAGWRNSWDKLNHYRPDWRENPPLPPIHLTTTEVDDNGRPVSKVTQVSQDVAFQDSGTVREGLDQGKRPGQDPFQDSGMDFQGSGTAIQDAGTDSSLTSEDGGSQTTLTKKSAEEEDAPFGGDAPGDGRRPSDRSSAREVEGDCVASDNDSPLDLPQHDYADGPVGGKSGSNRKARHTRAQLDLVREVRVFFPPELQVPDIPTVSQAVLDALAGDVPFSERTVDQLGARIRQRWTDHGFAAKQYTRTLRNPAGVAVALVRPLKGSDRYGCADPRCEAGANVDTGEACVPCAERIAERKAVRRLERAQAAAGGADIPSVDSPDVVAPEGPSLPAPRTTVEWWHCANEGCDVTGKTTPPADGVCPTCRDKEALAAEVAEAAFVPRPVPQVDLPLADREPDERTLRLQAKIAARFGTPEQQDLYCEAQQSPTPAPF